jgi:hypothetical protein
VTCAQREEGIAGIDLITGSCAFRSAIRKLSTALQIPTLRDGGQINSTQPPRFAVRVVDSFAGIERAETSANARTHQRARQPACPSPPCAQRRRSVSATAGRGALLPVFAGVTGAFRALIRQLGRPWERRRRYFTLVCDVRPLDGQSWDGLDRADRTELHARAILPVLTLEVRKARAWNTARARGPGQRQGNAELREMPGIGAQIDPAGGVGADELATSG